MSATLLEPWRQLRPDFLLWLVDGDDPTLVSEAASALVEDLLGGQERSLALEDHAGEVDLGMLADGCATPPLLVERRVVVLRNVGRFSATELAPLLSYLANPLPTTALVLVAGGGPVAAPLLALVKERGQLLQTRVDPRRRADWLHQRLARSGLSFEHSAERLLLAHLGEDAGRLVGLLEVLRAAYGDRAKLGPSELEPYLGEAGDVAPWELTDAIAEGRLEPALVATRRMLHSGERHPLVLLAVIARQVSQALVLDDPSIRSEAQAAQALGLPPGRSTFPARKGLELARLWRSEGVAEAVGWVADAEVALKGSTATPPEAVLEVLVARLCRLSARAARSR